MLISSIVLEFELVGGSLSCSLVVLSWNPLLMISWAVFPPSCFPLYSAVHRCNSSPGKWKWNLIYAWHRTIWRIHVHRCAAALANVTWDSVKPMFAKQWLVSSSKPFGFKVKSDPYHLKIPPIQPDTCDKSPARIRLWDAGNNACV